VKERHEHAGFGIDSRQIRAFVKIAVLASQGPICELVRPAVFQGDNVLDVKCINIVSFREPAVLAPISGPRGNLDTNGVRHAIDQRAVAWLSL
jgi:hypothetical protein